MSFASYMRGNVGEFALVALCAWALAGVGLNAFFLDGLAAALGYGGRLALVGFVVLVLVGLLYAVSYKRSRLALGVVVYALAVAALVAVSVLLSTGGAPYEDVEGNYLYFAVVVCASSTGCFALTRTLAGCAGWLAAVSLVCSAVQAFYESGEVVLSIVAVLTSLALIVHRNFRLGLERATSAQRPSHLRNFVAAVVPVAVVGAVAAGLWVGVIAPMAPGEVKVALITDYRSLPIEEYKGTAEEYPVLDTSMTSENLVDGERYTSDLRPPKEDPASDVVIDGRAMLEQDLEQAVADAASAGDAQAEGAQSGGAVEDVLDDEDQNPEWDTQSYTDEFPWALLAILVALLAVAVVLAYFLGRRAWRMRKLESILALSPREQVAELYRFQLARLARLGMPVPDGVTLSEFSASNARKLEMLDEEARVAFTDVTRIYEACAYGAVEPSEDEVVRLCAYYLGFWKGARAYLGNVRYFFQSFRL